MVHVKASMYAVVARRTGHLTTGASNGGTLHPPLAAATGVDGHCGVIVWTQIWCSRAAA